MNAYKLVIFDLDGTLLNTLEDLHDSTNHALTVCGLPSRTMEEVRCFVGNGIHKLIERAVPAGTDTVTMEQVFEEFKAWYALHCNDKTRTYEGVPELLQSLHSAGVKTAVVSNKADFGVQSLCKTYFSGDLDVAVGQREGIRIKPAPDAVNEVLRKLDIDRRNAVYVGDSDVDIDTARNAGTDCVSVAWGFRSRQFLLDHGASLIADSPESLKAYLLPGKRIGLSEKENCPDKRKI